MRISLLTRAAEMLEGSHIIEETVVMSRIGVRDLDFNRTTFVSVRQKSPIPKSIIGSTPQQASLLAYLLCLEERLRTLGICVRV